MSPWVRIDENAMEHPKVAGLPGESFKLWVQGLAHCQKFLTDGLIDRVSLRGLRSYSPKRVADLIDARLWVPAENDSVQVHDYLQWNESREHVLKVRAQGRDRIRRLRGRNAVTAREHNANALGGVECSSSQLPSSAEKRGGGTGEPTPSMRAGAFCQWYADTHERLFRVGYIGNPNGDYMTALRLVEKFTDRELQDAALVWFGQDDDFAKKGTRSIPKFASRATHCVELARKVAS